MTGGVLSLPTPLARLYAVAMETGITVTDIAPGSEPDGDLAAVACYGSHIGLSPDLDDDGERADVLAMALSVAAQMVRTAEQASPGDIVAPGGFVVIWRERTAPLGPAGRIATLIARQCGRDTASFAYDVPEFGDDAAPPGG